MLQILAKTFKNSFFSSHSFIRSFSFSFHALLGFAGKWTLVIHNSAYDILGLIGQFRHEEMDIGEVQHYIKTKLTDKGFDPVIDKNHTKV